MPLPAFPLINGNRYDFSSIEVLVEGVPFRGVKAVDYDDSTDGAKQYGTSARPLGRTRGKYDAKASLELFVEDAVVLRAALAQLGQGGWGEAIFTVVVAYAELAVSPPNIVKLFGCRVMHPSASHSQGPDGLTEKWELDVMDITRNGISLLSPQTLVK